MEGEVVSLTDRLQRREQQRLQTVESAPLQDVIELLLVAALERPELHREYLEEVMRLNPDVGLVVTGPTAKLLKDQGIRGLMNQALKQVRLKDE